MVKIKSVDGLQTALDGKLIASKNLEDLTDKPRARENLSLGNAATKTITISTSSPSGGSDGDIWFKIPS